MKYNKPNRFIALLLASLIFLLASCDRPDGRRYTLGDNREEDFYKYLCKVKFESDVDVFERDEVVLDFYLGLYRLTVGKSLKKIANSYKNNKGLGDDRRGDEFFTIHLCKSVNRSLSVGKILSDYTNIEGADLYKVITHNEAFSGGYGYTLSSREPYITYEHSEKFSVPEELIGEEDFGLFYLYVSTMIDYYDSDEYYVSESALYLIQYASVGDGKIKILFD